MMIAIGRRWLVMLALALAAWLAAAPSAVAQKLPDYKATAGMLQVGTDPERPDAEIFHVAYTLKGADPAKRPVTFAFNGGPGAVAGCFVHQRHARAFDRPRLAGWWGHDKHSLPLPAHPARMLHAPPPRLHAD